MSSKTVSQGDSVRLEISSSKQIEQGTITLSKNKYTIFENPDPSLRKNGFHYIVFLGIPKNIEPGAYPVKSRIRFTNKKWQANYFTLQIHAGKFRVRKITLPPKKQDLPKKNRQLRTENTIISKQFKKIRRRAYFHRPFIRPATGRITAPFGDKRTYNNTVQWQHSGVDIANPLNTPVKAVNRGKIILIRHFKIHGKTVMINHGFGIISIYNHLNKISVQNHQIVQRGEKIGLMGTTGLSTGSHVHWGLSIQNVRVDPIFWVNHPKFFNL